MNSTTLHHKPCQLWLLSAPAHPHHLHNHHEPGPFLSLFACLLQEIRRLFGEFGSIESVRFRSVAVADPKLPKKAAFITKQFHKERDNMNAYVVFSSDAEAIAALKLNNHVFHEKHLRVDLASNSKVSFFC